MKKIFRTPIIAVFLIMGLTQNIFAETNTSETLEKTITESNAKESVEIDLTQYLNKEAIANKETAEIDLGNGQTLTLQPVSPMEAQSRLYFSESVFLAKTWSGVLNDRPFTGINLKVTNDSKSPGYIDAQVVLDNYIHTTYTIYSIAPGYRATFSFGLQGYTLYLKANTTAPSNYYKINATDW